MGGGMIINELQTEHMILSYSTTSAIAVLPR